MADVELTVKQAAQALTGPEIAGDQGGVQCNLEDRSNAQTAVRSTMPLILFAWTAE